MYRFFQQWCPNIHNALDEDDSGDDYMTSPDSHVVDEEVIKSLSFFSHLFVSYLQLCRS